MRGSYNEHLAGHAVAFLLAFARRFDHYLSQKQWRRGPEMIDLPQKTVLIVGVGGAGGEASGLCAALGMRVLGIDPRVTEPPVGMADLATPDRLEERLGEADFMILTTPETPDTVEMFNTRLFARMKRATVVIGGKIVVEDHWPRTIDVEGSYREVRAFCAKGLTPEQRAHSDFLRKIKPYVQAWYGTWHETMPNQPFYQVNSRT
jgi:hypothetical protein